MLKKLVGNSSVYLIASLLNRGISFLLLPVYTRFLTPSDYGILAICAATYGVLSPLLTMNLGMAVNLLYFKLNEHDYKRLLSTVWMWYLLLPIPIAIFFETFGQGITETLFPTIPWHPYLRLAILISFLAIAQEIPLALFYAQQKAIKYASLTGSSFLINTSLLLYFVVVMKEGAFGSLKGQAIGLAIVTVVSHFIVFRRLGSFRDIVIDRKLLKRAFILCIPTVPYLFFSWVLNLSDRWILGYFVSTAEIGIYNVAYALGTFISTIAVALSSAFAPVYYENYKDPAFRQQLPELISLYLMGLTWATLALSVFSPELLRIMTSPDFYRAAQFVPVVASAYWVYGGIYVLSLNVIQNSGKTKWILVLTLPPAILNIGLNWLTVPYYGIWATSVNTLLAFIVMAILAYFISRRIDKLPYAWTSLNLVLAISISAYFIGIFWLTFESILLSLIAKIGLMIVAGGLMFITSGYNFRQLQTLYSKLRSNVFSK